VKIGVKRNLRGDVTRPRMRRAVQILALFVKGIKDQEKNAVHPGHFHKVPYSAHNGSGGICHAGLVPRVTAYWRVEDHGAGGDK